MLAQLAEPSTLNQLLDFASNFGGGVVVPIVLGVLTYLQLKAKYQVEKVERTLEQTTANTDKKLDANHNELLVVKEQTNGHMTKLIDQHAKQHAASLAEIESLRKLLMQSERHNAASQPTEPLEVKIVAPIPADSENARTAAAKLILQPLPSDPSSPEKH